MFKRLDLDLFGKEFEITLKKCIAQAKKSLVELVPVDDPNYYTSEEYLQQLIDNQTDLQVAESRNLIKFDQQINRQLIRHLMKIYPKCSIIPSGNFIYPPGGYMGWHTNSDFPCTRVYITYVETFNNSGFKFLSDGVVFDDVDDRELIIRQFEVGLDDKLLWHCVYSNTNRFSFGYRIEPF
jgi:hypothetical protein